MATNNDGHLVDSAGHPVVDFVWGNLPLQPNDERGVSNKLTYGYDNHVIAEDAWNGFPLYLPNTVGEKSGGVDYIVVPNVLGLTTASAQDALQDAEMTITTASAATNSASTITATARTSGNATATVTSSGAGAKYSVGTKITIAGLGVPDADLNGTWTVSANATNSVSFVSAATTALSSTGLSDAGLTGTSGTIKSQSVAAGATGKSVGAAITITPWA